MTIEEQILKINKTLEVIGNIISGQQKTLEQMLQYIKSLNKEIEKLKK